MIKISNVSKNLGKFKLKDISLELPPGYIYGLVGENGAGKTTLLHLLMGLYTADEGDIEIDGMTYEDNEKEIHNMTGVVLAEDIFDNAMNAESNGRLYGKYYSGFDEEMYFKYLENFEVNRKVRLKKLSRGQKLKCQFAFALACNPKLLILDEPTANFDPEFRDNFWSIIQQFVSDGEKSVVIATHLTDDLDRMADYLVYMENGKIHYSGNMENFRESYRILSGESYKIKLTDKSRLIHIEEKKYGAKALVRHRKGRTYDESLEVTYPSVEEFMYYYSKREGKNEHERYS